MKKDVWHRNHLIRDAMYAAIHEDMRRRDDLYVIGEGAHVKVGFDAPALAKEFPNRFLTLPISEDGNTNFGVGLALGGLRVVCDLISSDFAFRAMDSICNTAAKLAAVGEARTIVIKAEFMTGGPTTGQRIESLFTHVPGLNVCCPSNPGDAYACMLEALQTRAVTVMFEDRMIEDATTSEVDQEHWHSEHPDTKHPLLRKSGDAVTVVSYGITLRLLQDWLVDTPYELFDLRWLYPVRYEGALLNSLLATRRLLVVEPDVQHAGIGAEIIAHVAEVLPGVKVARLGAPRRTIPSARELHETMLPTREAVLAKCEEMTR